MNIPTVKSCCCLELRTVGLMIGFLQIFVHGLAICLLLMNPRTFLIIPVILTAMTVNLMWIYGIQELKMNIPTVKSCCCLELRTVGLMIGFLQIFVHGLAICLLLMNPRTFLIIPVILTAMTVNLMWIYGIQEKKPMLMLPALIHPLLASLAGIAFGSIYPIAVTVSTFGIFLSGSGAKLFEVSVGILGTWVAGYAATAFVVYLFIVQYSVYKHVDEASKRNTGTH